MEIGIASYDSILHYGLKVSLLSLDKSKNMKLIELDGLSVTHEAIVTE